MIFNFFLGIKFQEPPILPPYYIPRCELLEQLVAAVLTTEVDSTRFGTTVTVTGVGGFGKTTLVTALCHHDAIKAKFKSGFVFVEIGPQTCDPVVQLHQIYYQLTGTEYPAGNLNASNITKEVRQVTANQSNNLLVIIDDVWQVEDVEPIVRAFSHCKTIVTSRKNDIQQFIPSAVCITTGPMMPVEATSLLTAGVTFTNQLSDSDHRLLGDVAHDVHLWPILLCLVRGQLSHYVSQHRMVSSEAIKMVHHKLYEKGLTAFDRNNLSGNLSNRKYAVKACIEVTLDLLQESDAIKLKVVIFFAGLGCAIPVSLLGVLWKISVLDTNDAVDVLWAYGVVAFANSVVPSLGIYQRHIEVHTVISQYILENIQSEQVMQLSPYIDSGGALLSIASKLNQEFHKCSGSPDISSLDDREFLQYWYNVLMYSIIPHHLRQMNVWAIFDPHRAMYNILQPMLKAIATIALTDFSLSGIMSTFSNQVTIIINDCKKVLKEACRSRKPLYQLAQTCLVEKNHDGLVLELEDYCNNYPMGKIAERGVNLVNQIIPHCQGDYMIQSCFQNWLEGLHLMTTSYHFNTILSLPIVKTNINLCKDISSSLMLNAAKIKHTVDYIKSGKLQEDWELIEMNHLIKLQEVAPNTLRLMTKQ